MPKLKFREFVQLASPDVQIDAANGLVKNVHVLGFTSRNGRRYLPEAVRKALPFYRGKVVNLDHHIQNDFAPDAPIAKRFGRLVNERFDESTGVWADLKFNPKHSFAEAFVWFAENDPEAIGFSHDANGAGRLDQDGTYLVEEISGVKSVDLVADPATTRGLFESYRMTEEAMDPIPQTGEMDSAEHISNYIGAIAKDSSLDEKMKLKKIKAALKLMATEPDETLPGTEGDVAGELPDNAEGEKKAYESLRKSSHPAIKRILRKLDAIEVREAYAARKQAMTEKCKEAKLPDTLVTELFIETLVEAKDETRVAALLKERAGLSESHKPKSNDPNPVGGEKKITEILNEMWS